MKFGWVRPALNVVPLWIAGMTGLLSLVRECVGIFANKRLNRIRLLECARIFILAPPLHGGRSIEELSMLFLTTN